LDTGDYRTVHDFVEDDLDALSEREREVVRLAFGLPEGDPLSYSEIGDKLGVSGERIRQIRNVALRKLQQASNPDWPWPRGRAPEGWRLKDALDAAGFSWPSVHDWRADQLPPGHDMTGFVPDDAGLASEEIVPGIVTLRMDPILLLRDERVRNPANRERMGISVFACVGVSEDGHETTWAALTPKARPDRLTIKQEWREGGNYGWRRGRMSLMDGGRWVGPRAAFTAASWREIFNSFTDGRPRLTAEGLRAISAWRPR
jgi:hypothetical protein